MTLKTTVKPTVNLAEFDQTCRLEHEQRFTPERTGREVDVLIKVLELKPLERVLDLGCGWGRHLVELKKRGFENLVGVDVQGAFLEPIDGVTNRERLVRGETRSWRGGNGLPWVLEESRFDLLTGAQTFSQPRVFPGGHTETRTLTRFHYTLAELARLLKNAGFTVTDVYGDWQLNLYTAESPRTLLVSRKDA